MRKSIIGLLLLVVLFAGLLSACSSKTTTPVTTTTKPTTATTTTVKTTATTATTPTATQQYGGILRVITAQGPVSLGDPTVIRTNFGSIMADIPCYEALCVFDNTGTPHAVLATTWTVAPDKSSLTLTLRKGVKFHDGTTFDAKACQWNLNRMIAANVTTTASWSGIDVVDDYTIRINLKSYQNTILNNLEGTTGWMISPTAFQTYGADGIKLRPVGTGPYKLANYIPDTSVEFSRFDDYWGGKPYLDGVKFIIITDATTAQMTFLAGQADVIASASDANTADLAAKGYTIETRISAHQTLLPDSAHPDSPVSKLEVRQAMAYAIDNAAIAKSIGYGYWTPSSELAAPLQSGYIKGIGYQPQNVEKAKQLLAAAGYANGFTMNVNTSSTFNNDPLMSVQTYLKAVGITANIQTSSYAAYSDLGLKGWNNGCMWLPWGATDTNYSSFLDRYLGKAQVLYPCLAKPAGLTDLIAQSLATPDFETQKSLCQQCVKIITDNCIAVPIYIGDASYALQKNVHDTGFDQLGGAGFRWTVQKAWMSK
jgi:peptide/nickel transport system substrate-binding protein